MIDEEVKEFTRKYCGAIAKGLGVSMWKEVLTKLHSYGINTSDSGLWRTE